MRVEQDLVADRRHVAERLAGDREPVADPAALDYHVIGSADRHAPGDERDHSAATACCSGSRFASQIATARASAA